MFEQISEVEKQAIIDRQPEVVDNDVDIAAVIRFEIVNNETGAKMLEEVCVDSKLFELYELESELFFDADIETPVHDYLVFKYIPESWSYYSVNWDVDV